MGMRMGMGIKVGMRGRYNEDGNGSMNENWNVSETESAIVKLKWEKEWNR